MAHFTDLPTELILDIFTQLTCFTDAAHLASVTRTTWSIWQHRGNAQIIFDAVSPRCIEHLPDAKRLLRSQPPMLHEHSDVHEVIKRLHYNARRLAISICDFEAWEIYPRATKRPGPTRSWTKHPEPYMTPTERSRYIPAWYAVWTCVYDADCQSILNTTTLKAVHVMREVLYFITDHRSGEVTDDKHRDCEFDQYRLSLTKFDDMLLAAMDEKWMRLRGRDAWVPYGDDLSGHCAVIDGHQDQMKDIPDVA